jgi:hypothetical protein
MFSKEKKPFVPPAHGLAHRAWLVEIGAALLVVVILTVTESGGLFQDSGSLWHPVVGEIILRDGFIRTDPFSHTFEGKFWIPFQWLAEVGMAKLYEWAKYDGLFWATVALFGSMFGWLAGRAVRRGCHPILALLICSLTFMECCHHFHARPHLLTMAAMCFLFALLSDIEAGRTRLIHILWVLPFYTLWTNLHGGVMGGVGTMGIVFFGWGVYWLLGWPSPIRNWKIVIGLLLVSAASFATFLINPYGQDLLVMWSNVMKADLPKIINEHKPLELITAKGEINYVGVVVIGEAMLYVLILFGTWGQRPRVTWLLPLVWLALGISRIRHAPLFSLVAMIAILDMLPYTRWMRWLAKRSDLFVAPKSDDPAEPKQGLLAGRLFPVLMLIVPLIWGLRFVELDNQRWPIEVIPELRQFAERPDAKLFNEDLHAGMVIRYVPKMKVFIDDRCELYGEAFLMDYVDALRHRPEYWMKLWEERHGINVALTHQEKPSEERKGKKSKFTEYLLSSPEWTLVKECDAGCLFVRKSWAGAPK